MQAHNRSRTHTRLAVSSSRPSQLGTLSYNVDVNTVKRTDRRKRRVREKMDGQPESKRYRRKTSQRDTWKERTQRTTVERKKHT